MNRRISTALLLAAFAVAPGCSKGRPAAHATEPHAAEPVPPTPDTTPIEVLRTPAGLVLGVEGTPLPAAAGTPATPPPSPAVTPVP